MIEDLSHVFHRMAADMHVALPGVVRSYDSASQTAEIELGVQRVLPAEDTDDEDDTTETLPILPSVPVCFPRGGGFFMHFPLTAGDAVLVVFCESDINAWRQSGGVVDPGIGARHGLSGAVAIPGMFTRSNPSSDANSNLRIGIDGGGNQIEISATEVKCGGGASLAKSTNLDAHLSAIAADMTALSGSGASQYTTAAKAALDASSPIATTITKGS